MQQEMHKGFSTFTWTLALFCLPSALFPLAWFVSPAFSSHPTLTDGQINFFSIAFWTYPFFLLLIAGILFKLHQCKPTLAKALLAVAFVAFYGLVWHIVGYF